MEPRVGSACTLVAQLLSPQAPSLSDKPALADLAASDEIKALLAAPILLDTDALKGAKTSELDVAMARTLGLMQGGSSDVTATAASRHQRLFQERISIAALTSAQRLRKDYKQWQHGAPAYFSVLLCVWGGKEVAGG